MVERSKITNFDQESKKVDAVFANHSLKIQASSIFEITPRALLVDLNYICESEVFRENQSLTHLSLYRLKQSETATRNKL